MLGNHLVHRVHRIKYVMGKTLSHAQGKMGSGVYRVRSWWGHTTLSTVILVGWCKPQLRFLTLLGELSRDPITWYHVICVYHEKVLLKAFPTHIKLFETVYKPWSIIALKLGKFKENPWFSWNVWHQNDAILLLGKPVLCIHVKQFVHASAPRLVRVWLYGCTQCFLQWFSMTGNFDFW